MHIAVIGFASNPTITKAGTVSVGGQNVDIYYLLHNLSKTDVAVNYIDTPTNLDNWRQASEENLIEALQNYSCFLVDELVESRYSLVHTCGCEAGMAFMMARNIDKNLASLVWVHTNFATLSQRLFVAGEMSWDEVTKSSFYHREMIVNRSADHIITGSISEANELHHIFGIESSKITIVYRGVDHLIFKDRNSFRRLGVITSGRMTKRKDFVFFITAIDIARRKCPNLFPSGSCAIVGGTEEERKALGLQPLIHEKQLKNIIKLYDAKSHYQLALTLNRYKVFAGTSRYETFGLLPLEARACGTPTVLRRNPAYSELPGARVGGVVVDSDECEEFADALLKILLLGQEEWNDLSRKASATATGFSWTKYAQEHKAVYEALLRRY